MAEMIHPPTELVRYLSYIYGLHRDDLIFTGTPTNPPTEILLEASVSE